MPEFFLHGGGGIVDLTEIPNGLSAKETERFVRENGANICGTPGAQDPGAPVLQGEEKRPPPRVVIELKD